MYVWVVVALSEVEEQIRVRVACVVAVIGIARESVTDFFDNQVNVLCVNVSVRTSYDIKESLHIIDDGFKQLPALPSHVIAVKSSLSILKAF